MLVGCQENPRSILVLLLFLIQQHSYSTVCYGTFKTILAIAHLLGSAVCALAIRYTTAELLMGLGVSSFLCASFMMLMFTAMHFSLFIALLAPMTIYYFGTGFIVATVSAAIVRPFPKKMATAMAFCLFLQFLVSSGFSFISSVLNIQTVAPLALILMIISVLSMVLWLIKQPITWLWSETKYKLPFIPYDATWDLDERENLPKKYAMSILAETSS